jgi:hypothetical protein
MVDEIRAALTAEEWSASEATRDAHDARAMGACNSVSRNSDTGELFVREMYGARLHPREDQIATVYVEALPALIALANAALPDGHPNKITRRLVDAVKWSAGAVRNEAAEFRKLGDEQVARNRDAIAADLATAGAVLAALLPPD